MGDSRKFPRDLRTIDSTQLPLRQNRVVTDALHRDATLFPVGNNKLTTPGTWKPRFVNERIWAG